MKTFYEVQDIITAILKKKMVSKKKLEEANKRIINVLIYFPSNCSIHCEKFKEYFIDTTTNIIIYSWCRSINRILTGKIKYEGDDETKMFAQNYYFRHSNYKNKK